MNIAQAKEYIKESVQMYLKKDEYGDYRIPLVRQRPIFLLGAPGIGKSAIMEQIARELDIALVGYSMTHHTRQSALGLPFITEKEYGGSKFEVSEYTMSEIIASIYETIKESGVKEGILFLDEINCVSETLYPSMLQFLQFKTFGRHRVPDGWVIVTAGNPPQYNKSVREFDVVTLDRLKVLKVTEDYQTWRKYAADSGIHSAITGFLDGDKDSFYHIAATAEGNTYVTARGWEDLSEIIYMYEESNLPVTEELIGQYIQCDSIVKDFSAYYDLYVKYKTMFDANDVLKGVYDSASVDAIREASLDEKIALVGILLDGIKSNEKDIVNLQDMLKKVRGLVVKLKDGGDVQKGIDDAILAWKKVLDSKEKAGTLGTDEKRDIRRVIAFYEEVQKDCGTDGTKLAENYMNRVSALKSLVADEQERLHNAFDFMKMVFGVDSNEMVIFVTELTVNRTTSTFLSTFGSSDYDECNEILMIGNREEKLRAEIEQLFGDEQVGNN